MTKENLQWHPAFFAEMQIELAEEVDLLTFESEHSLGTKPKQIDVLIIKKLDDVYLVYAYACLYKSDTNHVDEISVEDITLTFVCSHYPREMIKHLKRVHFQ